MEAHQSLGFLSRYIELVASRHSLSTMGPSHKFEVSSSKQGLSKSSNICTMSSSLTPFDLYRFSLKKHFSASKISVGSVKVTFSTVSF